MKRWGLQRLLYVVLIASFVWISGVLAETFIERSPPSPRLDLLVIDVSPVYAPYHAFCRQNREACDLSGATQVVLSPRIRQLLHTVNSHVNREITFALDSEQYGVEEYWAYPQSGYGDCEDLALEKRARLVDQGLPRGALRLALVIHRLHTTTHCVLTVESDAGTYVLDSMSNEVRPWHAVPYNFEARELPDQSWERFDQSVWVFDF